MLGAGASTSKQQAVKRQCTHTRRIAVSDDDSEDEVPLDVTKGARTISTLASAKPVMSEKRVYVGALDPDVSREQLDDKVRQYGKIVDIWVADKFEKQLWDQKNTRS